MARRDSKSMMVPSPIQEAGFEGYSCGIDSPPNFIVVLEPVREQQPLLYDANGAPLGYPRRIGLNS